MPDQRHATEFYDAASTEFTRILRIARTISTQWRSRRCIHVRVDAFDVFVQQEIASPSDIRMLKRVLHFLLYDGKEFAEHVSKACRMPRNFKIRYGGRFGDRTQLVNY
jgi:hypothetical protein